MRIRTALIVLAVAPFWGLMAQTQLTSLSSGNGDNSSNPTYFLPYNDLLLFTAKTESEGLELWAKNGAETYLVKDLAPGNSSSLGPDLRDISVTLNGKLYFMANDGEYGTQLWSTNGTQTGTQRITTISGLDTKKITLVGNRIFFLVVKGERLQLWKSDGTAGGTQLVKGDLPVWNEPSYQGSANQLFFFTFQPEGSNNSRLWRSDGTESGTFPITGELTGNGAGSYATPAPTQYIEYKGELYFVARSEELFPYASVGLMKTDGTLENTLAVSGLYDGNYISTDYADAITLNDKLYFYFYSFDFNTIRIWETDGTEFGTQPIFDRTAVLYFIPSNLIGVDGKLVFTAFNDFGNTTLLKLDPATFQIEEIQELEVAPDRPFFFINDFNLAKFSQISPDLYYLAIGKANYTASSWVTDLTTANTYAVPAMDNIRQVMPYRDKLYFTLFTPDTGLELWQTDLTLSSREIAANINTTKQGLLSERYIPIGNKIFFVHNDVNSGRELWVYDTTSAATTIVTDIYPGAAPSFPKELTALGEFLYFSANSETSGRELWRSDGTAAGTIQIQDIEAGQGSSFPEHLFVFNEQLFFTLNREGRFFLAQLTGNGIEIIKDLGLNEFNQAFSLREVAVADSYFYFVLTAEGEDLWRSDGTTAGTIKLQDLYTLERLKTVNNRVFFSGQEAFQGKTELWTSDGTVANTFLVKNIGGDQSSHPGNFYAFGDQLIFTAYAPETGREYWISDGTTAGTTLLADLNPGIADGAPLSSQSTAFAELNDHLYFSAKNKDHGLELWTTDGTTFGTELVKDINPGVFGSLPNQLISDGNRIYFTAYTPESGVELWTSQGTAAGTKMMYDLIPGLTGSVPSHLFIMGQDLYFTAETPDAGRQLWKVNLEKVTSVQPMLRDDSFTLYPNPTVDYIYIKDTALKISDFRIFSAGGQAIRQLKIIDGDGIYVGDLPAGVYLLLGYANQRVISRKFVKTNGM